MFFLLWFPPPPVYIEQSIQLRGLMMTTALFSFTGLQLRACLMWYTRTLRFFSCGTLIIPSPLQSAINSQWATSLWTIQNNLLASGICWGSVWINSLRTRLSVQLPSAYCFPLISGLGETYFLDVVKVVEHITSLASKTLSSLSRTGWIDTLNSTESWTA